MAADLVTHGYSDEVCAAASDAQAIDWIAGTYLISEGAFTIGE
ncbi:hypothetical protein [Crateriforma conspicua]|nr:hypothetical protein [Crateriforma conspicua]